MRSLGVFVVILLALSLAHAQSIDGIITAPTSRKLCCIGGAPGSQYGLPQFVPPVPNTGCTTSDLAIQQSGLRPTAVSPNSTYIAEMLLFFPYCKEMLDEWQVASPQKQVLFTVPPVAFNPIWEGVKANFITTLNSAYSLVRALGHGGVVQPWISKECVNVLTRSICHSVFREADTRLAATTGLNLVKPIPAEVITAFDTTKQRYKTQWEYVTKNPQNDPAKQPTCRDVINTFLSVQLASNLTSVRNVALILPYADDCECGCASVGSSNLIAYQPRFAGAYVYNLTTLNPTLPGAWQVNATTAVPTSSFQQDGNWTCYLPWANAPQKNPLSYCGLRCPSTFRTNHQYTQAAIMMGVVGWISYVSTFFVFATMVCMPRYRHFPANLVLFVLFSSHILAFAFVFTITRGWRKTVCIDSISPRWGYHKGNGACVFNGLTVIFGGLGTTFFWCAVAINSFIAIYLKRDSILRSKWFEIGTHVICWGTPFVCALVSLAATQIGTPQQLLFCFVTEDPYHPKGSKAFSYQYPFFFGPIGFCIVIATGAIVMVLYEMRNLRAASGSGRFNKHIRIALFLVVFLGIYAFVFAYRFTLTKDGDVWRTALVNWALSAFEGTSQVGLSHEPSYGLWMAFNFFIGVQGALVSLLFGSNTDVLTFWGERVQNIREGRSFFSGITSYTASSKVGASSVRATGNAE